MRFGKGARWIALCVCALGLAASCAGKRDVAVIETSRGRIVIEFYEQDAPKHAANFKKLASEGYYDGSAFHRTLPGFVIQGGDPNSKDDDPRNDGQGGPNYTIPAEIGRKHERGSVAAARTDDSVNPTRASSGSQFYICLNPLEMLDGQYTVFGRVVEGMDVVDAIAQLPRISGDPSLAEHPTEKVVMKSVRIEKR
jgi:cyclophilin family peptidyl-prolyl cis-trans isomerase